MDDDMGKGEKPLAERVRDGERVITERARAAERAAADKVRDAAAAAQKRAIETEKAIADKIREGQHAAGDAMDELREDSTEEFQDLAETTRTLISENPWVATACAFGAGLLVGFFLRRD